MEAIEEITVVSRAAVRVGICAKSTITTGEDRIKRQREPGFIYAYAMRLRRLVLRMIMSEGARRRISIASKSRSSILLIS